MVSFDKAFKEKHVVDINALSYHALRKNIKLKEYKDGLYVSDPFVGFIGDCEMREHYNDISYMSEGGSCLLHKVNCVYGFTCADNTSRYAIKINNC